MAKKKFETSDLERGKSLLDIANSIENIDDSIKDILIETETKPSKENINQAITLINNSDNLSLSNKKDLLDNIKLNYIKIFNFNNCPDDYESLKSEAKFLSGITQYSFLLMAQRLQKIRDMELYQKDGYKDFKSFIEKELDIARTTVYCYIDVYSLFYSGVQSTEHETNTQFSKLFPVIPLLKTKNEKIPKAKIKERFLSEIRSKSEKDIKEEAKELKIQYGLIKPTDNKNRRKSNNQIILQVVKTIRNKIKKIKAEEIDYLMSELKDIKKTIKENNF